MLVILNGAERNEESFSMEILRCACLAAQADRPAWPGGQAQNDSTSSPQPGKNFYLKSAIDVFL